MSELKKLAEQLEGHGFKPIVAFDSTDGEWTSVHWKQADRAYAACANDDGTLSVIGLTAGQSAMATIGAELLHGLVYGATPEQGIAATVCDGDVSALQAKVKAQSDYIGKLCGEYKALDEQMGLRCAEYRATIRKLKAELDAATVGAGTCTIHPDGCYGRKYGIYKCSNCGELWQLGCDGPKERGWTRCPKCQARIKEEAE